MRAPRQLIVIGDSGVVGWGDREGVVGVSVCAAIGWGFRTHR